MAAANASPSGGEIPPASDATVDRVIAFLYALEADDNAKA